jgi:ABC-type branched-subunit amino acid transport system permease subunit
MKAADALLLLAIVILMALPLAVRPFVLSDFSIWFTYAIFAASLAFAWGHCGLLVLGHAVSFGLGAYAMSIVTLGKLPGLPGLQSSWIGLLAALLVPGAISALLGLIFFGGRGIKGPFFGIVTLALAVLAERVAINADYLGGMNGLMSVPPLALGLNGGGPVITDVLPLYLIMLGLLALVLLFLRLVVASRFGLMLGAIRENELRARSLGMNAAGLKTAALALAGSIAGLAGALFVVQFGFAAPSLIGFSLSLDVLIWVALGGRAHPVAAALGTLVIRWLDSQFSGALGAIWPALLGLFFMLSVVFLPGGLFGEAIARFDHWLLLRQERRRREPREGAGIRG